MKLKKILTLIIGLFLSLNLYTQTLAELKAAKVAKKEIKENIDKEIARLDKAIYRFPGWGKGISGLVGIDFTGTNNWFANDIESNTSRGFGLVLNGFVNGNKEKYFIRNHLLATLNTSQTTNSDIDNQTGIKAPKEKITSKASHLEVSNLSGYYFMKNIATSAKGGYTTTIFDFNNPGQLSFSAGITWTPNPELVAYIHPLGYQWTMPAGDFAASTGTAIGVNYKGKPIAAIEWTSTFNAFFAYQEGEVDGLKRSISDLSNWTWMNTITIEDLFKGIGLGIHVGLRNNRQLAFAKNVTDGGGLQLVYSIGLSYDFIK